MKVRDRLTLDAADDDDAPADDGGRAPLQSIPSASDGESALT